MEAVKDVCPEGGRFTKKFHPRQEDNFGNSPNYQGVHHLHVWGTLISCLSKIVSASPFAASSPNDRNICSYRIALLTLHNDPWPAPPGPTDILQLFSWLRNVPQMSCWKLSNLQPVYIWKQTNTVCLIVFWVLSWFTNLLISEKKDTKKEGESVFGA